MNSQAVSQGCNKILVVDDVVDNLQLLTNILQRKGYQVCCAESGKAALDAVQASKPDLILLDIAMPELDGYAVCQKIKENPATQDIPIIFISAVDEVPDKVRAFEVGGADYVTKPFNQKEMIARIKHQLNLQSARQEIQHLNLELEARVKRRTAELERTNKRLRNENRERRRAEKKLIFDTLHDELTQLPNRTLFMERVAQALSCTRRSPHYQFAVLFLDLDRFKIVNDSLGHAVGDRLLIEVAGKISACLGPQDTVARLGGDEFTVLLEDIQGGRDAVHMAERLQVAITQHFYLEGHRIVTSASIGIAMGGSHYQQLEAILRDADIAMYQAKARGRACYAMFDQDMYLKNLRLLRMESDLRQALERDEFVLHYQPIISLKTGRLAGFEALVRWQHPVDGLISPGEFIALSEDTGMIVPLGAWVLREACQQMRIWQDRYPAAAALRISVNLASKQLQEPGFSQRVDNILQETGLRGEDLRLELTESMLMERTEETIQVLQKLRDRNIQLSIDDFGTGYSSLSYLHRFPVTTLKIDRSFIGKMNHDTENFEIVRTVMTLAHTLSMEVVAEGVETLEQSSQLRDLGCEYGQGYFFSPPLDQEKASEFLVESMHWQVNVNGDGIESKSDVHPRSRRSKPLVHQPLHWHDLGEVS